MGVRCSLRLRLPSSRNTLRRRCQNRYVATFGGAQIPAMAVFMICGSRESSNEAKGTSVQVLVGQGHPDRFFFTFSRMTSCWGAAGAAVHRAGC